MKIEPLGDRGYIVSELQVAPFAVAEAIRNANLDWVDDAYASYESVGVFCRPDAPGLLEVERIIASMSAEAPVEPRVHQIPVCYDMGEDLQETAAFLALTVEQLIQAHCSESYTCYAIGFCPGFPYLGYLPEGISGVPRRAQPRLTVPPGSVAITGRQTCIYPLSTPGGWPIIGRTPLRIVDVASDHFPMSAGDEVRFSPIDEEEFRTLRGSTLGSI